jgi:hypothetical protein
MTMINATIEYRRFRAPTEHGAVLAEPSLQEAPGLVVENRLRRENWRRELQGRWLPDLARQARHDVWQAARCYTGQYLDVHDFHGCEDGVPIVATGHQPELFHPGVWIKNFANSAIAKSVGGGAIHLIIDNDAVASPSIRIPSGRLENPQMGTIAYDVASGETPYENRVVRDHGAFESFATRLQERLTPFVKQPLVGEYWPQVVAAAREQGNLGYAIAQARHQWEAEWGVQSCELPLSHVCDQEAFRWFLAHLLAHLPRFREIYNASLLEYRQAHRLRSRTHPVPELAREGEWLEAPFWVWRVDAPRRERLFVRRSGHQLELSNRKRSLGFLPLNTEVDASAAVARCADWSARGWRFRPRALLTTMFARMFLSDLFIHGIGGAKYDQLTDVIIQRFFDIEPPTYLVLTATAKLPLPDTATNMADVRRLDGLLRELRYNPQRHVALDAETRPLVADKRRWIAADEANLDRRARHRALTSINERLQPFVARQRAELITQRAELLRQIKRDRVLGSREFAFCVFPRETLQPLLLDI